jgi:hypothetical protein
MVAGLYYDGFKMVMMVVVKMETIKDGADEKIDAAHIRNISKGKEEAVLYNWQDADEEIIQRVVVSGVWHPGPMETETCVPYKMSSRYEFLHRMGTSNIQGSSGMRSKTKSRKNGYKW